MILEQSRDRIVDINQRAPEARRGILENRALGAGLPDNEQLAEANKAKIDGFKNATNNELARLQMEADKLNLLKASLKMDQADPELQPKTNLQPEVEQLTNVPSRFDMREAVRNIYKKITKQQDSTIDTEPTQNLTEVQEQLRQNSIDQKVAPLMPELNTLLLNSSFEDIMELQLRLKTDPNALTFASDTSDSSLLAEYSNKMKELLLVASSEDTTAVLKKAAERFSKLAESEVDARYEERFGTALLALNACTTRSGVENLLNSRFSNLFSTYNSVKNGSISLRDFGQKLAESMPSLSKRHRITAGATGLEAVAARFVAAIDQKLAQVPN